jgi:hypothetical protein
MLLPVTGSLNEVHYCLLALPLCAALLTGRGGGPAQVLGAIALLVLWVPLGFFQESSNAVDAQLRWAAGSSLALLAACAARLPAMTARA